VFPGPTGGGLRSAVEPGPRSVGENCAQEYAREWHVAATCGLSRERARFFEQVDAGSEVRNAAHCICGPPVEWMRIVIRAGW
jgi:hypothetical protein